ncbi:hypothetical protein WBG78_05510 [Chryseolinea sp. T2]|uniref:hypothetical protein n=1 Tax=Chryseolinea sp. T2 TaxID=3129255 RepID=UPI003078287F
MHNVILNLRNELIRSISAIDAWFDVDGALLSQKISATETVAEFLYNLTHSSRDLLDAITYKSQRSLSGPMDLQFPHDSSGVRFLRKGIGRIELESARAELREQLDRCLIYLELLLQKQEMHNDDIVHFDGYQGVYLLLIHLKRHLGDLNQLGERHRDIAPYW